MLIGMLFVFEIQGAYFLWAGGVEGVFCHWKSNLHEIYVCRNLTLTFSYSLKSLF